MSSAVLLLTSSILLLEHAPAQKALTKTVEHVQLAKSIAFLATPSTVLLVIKDSSPVELSVWTAPPIASIALPPPSAPSATQDSMPMVLESVSPSAPKPKVHQLQAMEE